MSTSIYCSTAPAAQLVAVSALSQASASSAAADGSKSTPATEFRSVKAGNKVQSGEWLLVEAYTAMWLLALGLVLLTIFKQRKLDAHIEQLSAELAEARKQQDADAGDR